MYSRSSATGTAPTICEPSTNTNAPTARANSLIAGMSERCPDAVCTPLKATSCVPLSTCRAMSSGSRPPLRNGTCRTS